METLAVLVAAAIGVVGFLSIVTGIVMWARQGAWQRDRWTGGPYLMLVGASLGVLFGLIMMVPGVVPWWDYSSPWLCWTLGVVFGWTLGWTLGVVFGFVARLVWLRPKRG